ncbi:MFS transporter [Rhodococcoides yunnanense]|uniref:MFS transporter n=1 Tax=Rhodococcoides yunnanense TaxID=278209 RepID=UPI000A04B6EC|nr:MFS transporter [Rhodococcus yunnanensis]
MRYRTQIGARLRPTTRPHLVLTAAALAQFLVAFDMSVMNVALPDIQSSLGFSDADLSWVVNAYALAFGGLLLLGGRLCDVLGTRRVLLAGFAIFGLVSILGALSTAPWMLVVARAVQGVGAALIAPAGLAALSAMFPTGKQRARAFGIGAMASAGGGAIGVVLSGLLTDAVDWRLVMFSAAPFTVIAACAAFVGMPSHSGGRTGRLDTVGAALVTSGLVLLAYTVVETEDRGWTDPLVLVGFGVTAVLLGIFALVESRVAEPLVRFATLRRPRIAAANLIMCVLCAAQFSGFFFVSLYLQRGLGYSPTRTGLAFLPFCIGLVLAIVLSTKLLTRVGAKPLLVGGTALASAGLFWFSRMTTDSDFLAIVLGPSLILSIGIGLCFMPLSNIATADLPPDEVGMASGLLNTSRQIGGSIGLAALVSVAAAASARFDGPALDGLVDGYSTALLVCAGLLAVGFLLALAFPRPTALSEPTAFSEPTVFSEPTTDAAETSDDEDQILSNKPLT